MNVWEQLRAGKRLTEEEKKQICHEMVTTESRMEKLILKHFAEEDYQKVAERRIGGGLIGGKACGLLAARKLIENLLPEYVELLEPHDSFFIGSDVFCGYLKDNDCLELRERQRNISGRGKS